MADLSTYYSNQEASLHLLASATDTPSDTNKVEITELSDIPNNWKIDEFTPFGEESPTQVPTTFEARTIDISFKHKPTDTIHLAIETSNTNKTSALYAVNRGGYGSNDGAYISFTAYTQTYNVVHSDGALVMVNATLAITGDITKTINS